MVYSIIFQATEIGKSVIVLRKHASKDVHQIARSLIEVWKDMVDEWVNATTKITVSENTPESMNPSVVDVEEGLPSPPLDDLAFLNPHSMSLELSEIQKNENRNNRKPPVEKQNVTKWKPHKPLNRKPWFQNQPWSNQVNNQLLTQYWDTNETEYGAEVAKSGTHNSF
ncbi:putative transcription regulator IWS1 family [Helianthus anomalus]